MLAIMVTLLKILIKQLFKIKSYTMKKITMLHQGEMKEFRITYECPEYVFCECDADPGARGFFTRNYIAKNQQS